MPPYLTCVSLTSNTGVDHRTLDLIPGKSYLVGRASKNKHETRAGPRNTLFDCAVMSREHAELRSSLGQHPGRQVTLTDKQSLHGTTVNGRRLMPHAPFTLKSGDVIKFGERVSRGIEAHDGVSVTFTHLHELDSYHESNYRPLSPTNVRGFRVPDDSEQSDVESNGGSFVSSLYESSSVKTTPEQPKMGSQNKPIDLESVTTSNNKVVSLIDADEEEGGMVAESQPTPNASQPAPQSAAFESMTPDEVSIPIPRPTPAAAPLPTESIPNILESNSDDDGDSVVEDHTGLHQVLDEPDEAVSSEGQQSDDEVGEAQDSFDTDSLDGSFGLYVSEGSVSENEECASFASQRQQSEDLGEVNMPAEKPAWLDQLVEEASSAAKPRYDPVRCSQPPENDVTDLSIVAQPAPASSTYTTRWDMQPAYDTQCSAHDLYGLPQSTQTYVESSISTPTLNTTSASGKGKLSIDNLVEPPASAPEETTGTVHSSLFFPRSILPASFTAATTKADPHPAGTNKRKAAEVEDHECVEPAAKKAATVDAATATHRAVAIPARRPKKQKSLACRIAGSAMKYTASATVGAAATVAFLNSTYAEQLIQYLS